MTGALGSRVATKLQIPDNGEQNPVAPYLGHLNGLAGACLNYYGPLEDTGRGSFREGFVLTKQTQ